MTYKKPNFHNYLMSMFFPLLILKDSAYLYHNYLPKNAVALRANVKGLRALYFARFIRKMFITSHGFSTRKRNTAFKKRIYASLNGYIHHLGLYVFLYLHKRNANIAGFPKAKKIPNGFAAKLDPLSPFVIKYIYNDYTDQEWKFYPLLLFTADHKSLYLSVASIYKFQTSLI